jgi:hypothetical protein
MQKNKCSKPDRSKPRKGRIDSVKARSPRPLTVEPHDRTSATDKQTLTKLNALLKATKTLQSWSEDIEASVGRLHDRLTNIETALLAIDYRTASGYDCPPSPVKVVPRVIPTVEHVKPHDLLARQYLLGRAAASSVWPDNVYAAWVSSGGRYAVSYFDHCMDHAEARSRALAKAGGAENENSDILVIGPWHGDTTLAPAGAVMAVRWSTSMYEVEDPFKFSQQEE